MGGSRPVGLNVQKRVEEDQRIARNQGIVKELVLAGCTVLFTVIIPSPLFMLVCTLFVYMPASNWVLGYSRPVFRSLKVLGTAEWHMKVDRYERDRERRKEEEQ